IEVKAGQPLTDDATSATIRNLFATRQFSDIRIDARDVAGGVAVTVDLFRSYRVSPLKFSSAPVARAELRRVVGFAEGSVFDPGGVAVGGGAIKGRLWEEVYVRAVVPPEPPFD